MTPPKENEDARYLWDALGDLSAAQVVAIEANDTDGLDALLDQKALLLSELAARDTARDVAGDPSLVALLLAAQSHEDNAETAFHAAQARLAHKMAALRVRRAAQSAFQRGATAEPVFVNYQG